MALPGEDASHPAYRPLVRVAPLKAEDPADPGRVQVIMRVECQELPEGQARLLCELIKTQGILGPAPPAPPANSGDGT